MIHLFKVMISRLHPKDWNTGDPLLGQMLSEPDDRQRLVYVITRTGQEPDLLARNNRVAPGFGKGLQVPACFLTHSPLLILSTQRIYKGFAMRIVKGQFPGNPLK